MNLKEEIVYNTNFDISFKVKKEGKKFIDFIDAFNEDVEEYGKEKTIMLYSMIFGTDLKEDFENAVSVLSEEGEPFSVAAWLKSPEGKNAMANTAKKIEQQHGANNQIVNNSKETLNSPTFKLSMLWNKIKSFFTGSFTSIKKIISTGNWQELFKLPLFKGALVAGGVGALLLVLKKIFGKKRIEAEEQKIKEQAIKAGYTK